MPDDIPRPHRPVLTDLQQSCCWRWGKQGRLSYTVCQVALASELLQRQRGADRVPGGASQQESARGEVSVAGQMCSCRRFPVVHMALRFPIYWDCSEDNSVQNIGSICLQITEIISTISQLKQNQSIRLSAVWTVR